MQQATSPFRDREALYEARYHARLAQRNQNRAVPRLPLTPPPEITDTAQVLSLNVKRKCCKSSPRCLRCPVVHHRLRQANTKDLDQQALGRLLTQLRAS